MTWLLLDCYNLYFLMVLTDTLTFLSLSNPVLKRFLKRVNSLYPGVLGSRGDGGTHNGVIPASINNPYPSVPPPPPPSAPPSAPPAAPCHRPTLVSSQHHHSNLGEPVAPSPRRITKTYRTQLTRPLTLTRVHRPIDSKTRHKVLESSSLNKRFQSVRDSIPMQETNSLDWEIPGVECWDCDSSDQLNTKRTKLDMADRQDRCDDRDSDMENDPNIGQSPQASLCVSLIPLPSSPRKLSVDQLSPVVTCPSPAIHSGVTPSVSCPSPAIHSGVTPSVSCHLTDPRATSTPVDTLQQVPYIDTSAWHSIIVSCSNLLYSSIVVFIIFKDFLGVSYNIKSYEKCSICT